MGFAQKGGDRDAFSKLASHHPRPKHSPGHAFGAAGLRPAPGHGPSRGRGVPEEVRLSDGTVAIKDVGRIVLATVIDYNGTPTDTEDDVFISQSIESVSGPHPEAESGFTLFCEVVVPALT